MTQADQSADIRVTENMGRWVAELGFSDLPDPVIGHIKTCLIDGLGCALYGARQPWTEIAARVAIQSSGGRGISLIGWHETVNASDAALVNGTALHGYEIDDVHVSSSYHPACVTIPAVLALAQDRKLDGKRFLVALVAGYEIGIRIGICAGTTHSTSGFHVTGTIGPAGAAAACAAALELDPLRAMHAIAIGATQASGLYAARMGAMAKRFHAGRASQSGILAALLAEQGFTGSDVAIEAPFGGFMSTLHGQFPSETILEGLGQNWETSRVGFKIYSACASAHTTIDAIKELRHQGLTADNLESLTIWMTKKGQTNVGWPYVPTELVSAQMNGSFAAAVTLLDGEAFIDQYREDRLADPRILALVKKVTILHDPELDNGGASKRHAMRMEARLSDGRELTTFIQDRSGSAERPLTRADIERKFIQLTKAHFSSDHVEEIFNMIEHIEDLDNIEPLTRLLTLAWSTA